MNRKTPLGHVLGLGSAKQGSGHWWSQRMSAVAMAPLGLWLVWSLAGLVNGQAPDYTTLTQWLRAPLNTVLVSLTLLVMLYHSHLGIQVILEDYIKHGWLRVTTMILQKFVHVALAFAGIYSVLKIAFGA
ncbi:MAG: succinate dehydrogenase, hydrophobic membrane anchor protein [Gammaproteobacteria bacterium]|nr:succinate dehydrogenase, hydrophobic membrane anchor protein [Gammaproteobacteria bacterium]